MYDQEINIPSKEAIQRATHILNDYSKDSHADIICLALAFDRQHRQAKQNKDILDKILKEFPVGNIKEHTVESLPERISYYLKELAEYTQRVEDIEDKKLDHEQPICTKCISNLTYYDGWHCMCEEKEIDRTCWINFETSDVWKSCADDLIDYAREALANLAAWGKGYAKTEREMETIRKAIAKYDELRAQSE
jgi:hypothetical protein